MRPFVAERKCRWTFKPTDAAREAPRRLYRYSEGLPRRIFHYQWQGIGHADVYIDTDWAGCPRTRTSTSGGCVIPGSHAVRSWVSAQTSVALSSGEAEFNGVVRGRALDLDTRVCSETWV